MGRSELYVQTIEDRVLWWQTISATQLSDGAMAYGPGGPWDRVNCVFQQWGTTYCGGRPW